MRQRRQNALPHGVDGGRNIDKAVAANADLHVFFEHVAARPFQKGSNAQTAPFAVRSGHGRPRVKPGPAGECQRLVHHVFKTAAVVHLAHRVAVGHLFGLHEITAAQRDAVNAGHARGLVDQPLDGVNRFRAAGTTVGTGRCRVGQHRPEIKINGRDVIHTGLYPRANQQLNGHPHTRGVSANVGHRLHAQCQNFSAGVQGHFGVDVHIAPMSGR